MSATALLPWDSPNQHLGVGLGHGAVGLLHWVQLNSRQGLMRREIRLDLAAGAQQLRRWRAGLARSSDSLDRTRASLYLGAFQCIFMPTKRGC